MKRVKNLFAYIDASIDERNEVCALAFTPLFRQRSDIHQRHNMSLQDGNITTEEFLLFFGETGTQKDAARNARYWLKEIDGYGKTDGYITLVG